MSKPCPNCGDDMTKTGITSTRHDVYTCDRCECDYLAYFDELFPIHDTINVICNIAASGELTREFPE